MIREVVEVGLSKSRRAQWADVPEALYNDIDAYVPPLRRDVIKQQNPAHNPLFKYADIEHFLLLEDGQPVGRIAATALHAVADSGVGYFGFLDAVADEDAIGRLLEAVEGWLRSRGRTRCTGPYNYFSGQEMGVLLNCFDERPSLFQTWNPASTPKLLADCGYEITTRMSTYRVTPTELDAAEAGLYRVADRVRSELGFTTRPARGGRRLATDVELIRLAFNAAFSQSPENLPYEEDVFASMIAPLRNLLDPELIRICEHDGDVIGFAVATPDLNPVLAALNGRLRLLDLPRVKRLRRECRTAVVLLVGTVPATPLGVGHLLFADGLKAVRAGRYTSAETTWVHQDNRAMNGLMRGLVGAEPHRDFALFGKDLI